MNFSVVPLGDDPYVRTTENLAKAGAKVIACDSQDSEYPAELAIDGAPGTFWHTAWRPSPAPLPHFLTIDFGKTRILQGLNCTPRQDQANARVADCEVYLSDDPNQWGAPVATVKLKNESIPQNIRFDAPAPGRYLKLIIKSTQGKNDPNAAIAELGVIE